MNLKQSTLMNYNELEIDDYNKIQKKHSTLIIKSK